MVKYWPADSVNGVYLTKTEVINSQLSYTGKSYKQSALDNDPVFQISRTSKSGNVTTTSYASNGEFTQKWSDRHLLFPPVEFTNTYSAAFNGIDGAISFGNNLSYNTGQEWSMSFWFKVQNLSTRRTLYSKTSNDVNVYGIGIYIETNGRVFIQTRSPSSLAAHTSSLSFTEDVWHNLTLTYNGSGNQNGFRLYFNGTIDTIPASATLGNISTTEHARLGIRNSSFPFSGNIDEVSFWTKALSASEVVQLYNSGSPFLLTDHSATAYLDHYYRLGDGDNSIIYDNKYSVNGTIIGGVTFVEDVP